MIIVACANGDAYRPPKPSSLLSEREYPPRDPERKEKNKNATRKFRVHFDVPPRDPALQTFPPSFGELGLLYDIL